MPRISKVEFRIGDSFQSFELYYNRSKGFFYKDFPKKFVQTVKAVDGDKCDYAYEYATENDLLNDTKKLIRRYFEVTKSEKRIIILRFQLSTGLSMMKTGIGSWSGSSTIKGIKLVSDHASGMLDYGFAFDYEVGIVLEASERTFFEEWLDEDGKVLQTSTHGRHLIKHSHSDEIEIDFTLERYQFLLRMQESIKGVAYKMLEFFADKEKFLLAMDTGGKNLLEFKEDKKLGKK